MKNLKSVLSLILTLSFLASLCPPAYAQDLGQSGELVYESENTRIYSIHNPDGTITLQQYEYGKWQKNVTARPGSMEPLVVENAGGKIEKIEVLGNKSVIISSQPYSRYTVQLGTITYKYAAYDSAGICRAEVSYSYDSVPTSTIYELETIPGTLYDLATLIGMIITLMSVPEAFAANLAAGIKALFGFGASAAGFYLTKSTIPLSSERTKYIFTFKDIDNPRNTNTLTSYYYYITDEDSDRIGNESWDGMIPDSCWKTKELSDTVMGHLWQYDNYRVESWSRT